MNAVLVIISNNGQAIVVINREAVEIVFFLHHTVQSALDLDVVVRESVMSLTGDGSSSPMSFLGKEG